MTISSPLFCWILFVFSKILDYPIFRALHVCVRLLYTQILFPFVSRFMHKRIQDINFVLVIRHSAKKGSGFHATLSDLDMTLVFSGTEISLSQCDEIHSELGFLKKYLPMIGEIEIFSEQEYAELQILLNTHKEAFSILRELKKIGWIEEKMSKQLDPYHLFKSKRSIARSLTTLNQKIYKTSQIKQKGNVAFLGSIFRSNLAKTLYLVERNKQMLSQTNFYSREYGVHINTQKESENALFLEPDLAFQLLKISPTHFDDPNLSSQPTLSDKEKQLRLALLKHEYLYAVASPRVHIQFRNEAGIWSERLKSQISDLNIT